MYTIKVLTAVSLTEIVDAFNTAFSDYIIPFQLTEEALANKIVAENIELNASVAAFYGETIAGFILTGIDTIESKLVAYNAGTGVIPTHRGKKLTQVMYSYLLPLLKEKGINKSKLEVIVNNHRAVAVYKKIGFLIGRELVCFKGYVLDMGTNKLVYFTQVDLCGILMDNDFDSQPSYQNSQNTIQRSHENISTVVAILNQQQVGFISYNRNTGRIHQFVVKKEYRCQRIGYGLFNYVQLQCTGKPLSIINIDKSDKNTISFLLKLGFEITVEQYEMVLKSDKI